MRLSKSGAVILAVVIVVAAGCDEPSGLEDVEPVRIILFPSVSTIPLNTENTILVQITGGGGIDLTGQVDVQWAVTDSAIMRIVSADRSGAVLQGLAVGGANLTASVSAGDSTLSASTAVVVVP
jgi:hypothetical protein